LEPVGQQHQSHEERKEHRQDEKLDDAEMDGTTEPRHGGSVARLASREAHPVRCIIDPRVVHCALMRRVRRRLAAGAIAGLVTIVLAVSCTGEQHLRATTIQLGRSINPDKTVANHTTRFKPNDTIYAAVLTDGSGSGTLKVRWLFRGQVVSEPEEKISYRGPAATEFHLQNNTGFPPGDYSAEFFLDGKSIGTRAFRVDVEKGAR
jgi:hypothetical protein